MSLVAHLRRQRMSKGLGLLFVQRGWTVHARCCHLSIRQIPDIELDMAWFAKNRGLCPVFSERWRRPLRSLLCIPKAMRFTAAPIG